MITYKLWDMGKNGALKKEARNLATAKNKCVIQELAMEYGLWHFMIFCQKIIFDTLIYIVVSHNIDV